MICLSILYNLFETNPNFNTNPNLNPKYNETPDYVCSSYPAFVHKHSGTVEDRREEHTKLLQNLHTAEQREGELKMAHQQLAHQLQMEKQAQDTLKKRYL